MSNTTDIICRRGYTPTGLHLRESGEEGVESRTIEGRAILFNTPSDVLWADDDMEAREVIDPAAITRELLDRCDIKFTMFHDRQLILARSNNGKGTLSYDVDEGGVTFSFEAPETADGDKAVSMVKRGDVSGCSFAFRTCYQDKGHVERSAEKRDGKTFVTYRVKKVTDVMDFTLAADPAYPATSVELKRELEPQPQEEEEQPKDLTKMREQIDEMRSASKRRI